MDVFFPLVNVWTSPDLITHIRMYLNKLVKSCLLIYFCHPSYRSVVNLIKRILSVTEDNENIEKGFRVQLVRMMLNFSKYDIFPLVDFLIENLSQQNHHAVENALEILILYVENGYDFNDKLEKMLTKFCQILGRTQNTTIIK